MEFGRPGFCFGNKPYIAASVVARHVCGASRTEDIQSSQCTSGSVAQRADMGRRRKPKTPCQAARRPRNRPWPPTHGSRKRTARAGRQMVDPDDDCTRRDLATHHLTTEQGKSPLSRGFVMVEIAYRVPPLFEVVLPKRAKGSMAKTIPGHQPRQNGLIVQKESRSRMTAKPLRPWKFSRRQ